MAKNDDNQIHNRLKILSQIEPSTQATNRAVQRTRDALINKENANKHTSTIIWLNMFRNPIIKFAAAALLMIGFGYIGGLISAQQPPDLEELRTTIRNDLAKERLKKFAVMIEGEYKKIEDLKKSPRGFRITIAR